MELTLFAVLITLTGFLIFMGYYSRERAFSMIGFSFLFFLGFLVVMPGGLTYTTGSTETYNWACGDICEQPGTCTGTPAERDCTLFDGNQSQCELYGCNWDNDTQLCSGVVGNCTQFTELTCQAVGCDWTPATATTNSTYISSITKVNNTTSWNDTISRLLGVWLAIIGIVGAAINITEIKKGVYND